MRNNLFEQVIFDGSKIAQATFTVDATTDVVTSDTHGFVGGEVLQLTTATTLPAGLALATNYYVINVTTDTFQLSATPGGTAINITDTGTGVHTLHVCGQAVFVGDYQYVDLSLCFTSSPTMTVKFQGSIAKPDACPNFYAAQALTNRWDYVMVLDLNQETGAGGESGIAGDTGVSCSGSADYRLFRLNTCGLSWICANLTAFTQGKIDVRCSGYK
jgi:hypothetical protein